MGLLLCILLGITVGWLWAALEEVDQGVFARMGLGAIGALIGHLTFATFSDKLTVLSVSWLGILGSLLAGIIIISIGLRLHEYDPRDRNPV